MNMVFVFILMLGVTAHSGDGVKPIFCAGNDAVNTELCKTFSIVLEGIRTRSEIINRNVKYMKSLRPENPLIKEIEANNETIRQGMEKDLSPFRSLVEF